MIYISKKYNLLQNILSQHIKTKIVRLLKSKIFNEKQNVTKKSLKV